MLKFLFPLAWKGNFFCCFKTDISVIPAEEFVNHMCNNESSVCACDIYEKESEVTEHVLAANIVNM